VLSENKYAHWLLIVFFASACGIALFLRNSPFFATLGITFVSIVLEALPFMLVGTLIGGFIEVFVSRDQIAAFLPGRRRHTIFLAACLGLIFPVCECAIVPVIRRLIKKGIPLGAAVAFLLAGPIVNPIVFASTAVAYGYDWRIAVARIALGYGIAAAIGFFVDLIFSKQQAVHDPVPEAEASDGCPNHSRQPTIWQKSGHAVRHAADDFVQIGGYLVLGALAAGIIQVLVSRQALVSMMGVPSISVLMMMALAMILSLCSETDAFIAASFRFTAISISAQMAFMLLGPMLDIKLLLMYLHLFKKRFIVVLAGLIVVSVFSAALILEYAW
jgi:uncharacterized membrane protein YraQ (UPF0718 family)